MTAATPPVSYLATRARSLAPSLHEALEECAGCRPWNSGASVTPGMEWAPIRVVLFGVFPDVRAGLFLRSRRRAAMPREVG